MPIWAVVLLTGQVMDMGVCSKIANILPRSKWKKSVVSRDKSTQDSILGSEHPPAVGSYTEHRLVCDIVRRLALGEQTGSHVN